MILIGERLNSSRPAIRKALLEKNEKYLVEQARLQEKAGASYIDLNASALIEEEVEALRWAIPVLRENIRLPLALDTPNPKAMEIALQLHRGRPLLNSLTAEASKLQSLLPIVEEHKPQVIILCLDEEGMPNRAEKALCIAERMVELLSHRGIAEEDIFVDPLVRPVGVDPLAGILFLESLEKIKFKLPRVKTVGGVSNVSFGLPGRRLLNRTFLVLAMKAGLDAAICDPLDIELRASLAAAAALLGRDTDLRYYLRFHRELGKP
ncbi:MAG: dihydropteroate synthase [Candidatus Aminicenantales bacterium]